MSMARNCDPNEVDETYELASVEAVLAGTLALMTGFAQAGAQCPHRPAMAGKLVSNFGQLADHPGLSDTMHRVMNRLAGHWQRELVRMTGSGPSDPVATHSAPAKLQ